MYSANDLNLSAICFAWIVLFNFSPSIKKCLVQEVQVIDHHFCTEIFPSILYEIHPRDRILQMDSKVLVLKENIDFIEWIFVNLKNFLLYSYLDHVRQDKPVERAGGYTREYPCLRAIQEAFDMLLFVKEDSLINVKKESIDEQADWRERATCNKLQPQFKCP